MSAQAVKFPPTGDTFLWLGAALALAGTALLVDPSAEAAFDAPKRLCALGGASVAGFALCLRATTWSWRRVSPAARFVLVSGVLALAWIFVATCCSPHPVQAWTALRRLCLFAILLPVGASSAFDAQGGRRLFAVFAALVSTNAVVSIGQAAGWSLPFAVARVGGRFDTGALLGNEGYVALACALLGAASAGLVCNGETRRLRLLGVATFVLALASIAVNHQATSAIALAFAVAVVVAVRLGQRAFAASLFGVVALVWVVILPGWMAARWPGDSEGIQRMTTYRLGAWISAGHMVRQRPLTGFGPGTFAAEQQVHRFAAEEALRERFVQPTGASFVTTHQDYLQLAAEAGVPALLFVLAAIGSLLRGLIGLPRDNGPERGVLLGVLSAGAIAALAWFPLQIPFTGCVLLLAAGRAWRLLADGAA